MSPLSQEELPVRSYFLTLYPMLQREIGRNSSHPLTLVTHKLKTITRTHSLPWLF